MNQHYVFTPTIVRHLMTIEAARQTVRLTVLEMHRLDRRAQVVLGLFSRQDTITSADAANALGLSPRTVPTCSRLGNPRLAGTRRSGTQSRRYRLSAEYRRFMGGLSAE